MMQSRQSAIHTYQATPNK